MATIPQKQSSDPPHLQRCEGNTKHQQADSGSVEVKSHQHSPKSSTMKIDTNRP
tara:strand:+ start:1311 stop:1472 length:162 start_codon:yes stop_codon:yes gene_type:complete